MAADVVELSERSATQIKQYVSLGLWLLSARAYQWATLIGVSIAFGFTLAQPTILRIVTCVLFTLLTHLPTWWNGKPKERTT